MYLTDYRADADTELYRVCDAGTGAKRGAIPCCICGADTECCCREARTGAVDSCRRPGLCANGRFRRRSAGCGLDVAVRESQRKGSDGLWLAEEPEHRENRNALWHRFRCRDRHAGPRHRAGNVSFADYTPDGGYRVIVDHEAGYQTVYQHLSSLSVGEGDVVEQGQLLGLSGASGWVTGPQLHVALLKDGDYLDPLLFMQRWTPVTQTTRITKRAGALPARFDISSKQNRADCSRICSRKIFRLFTSTEYFSFRSGKKFRSM